ncbi:MAG: efflux RND transporter periplasmic adaptor subunit, partial [Terriglobales bacterium]
NAAGGAGNAAGGAGNAAGFETARVGAGRLTRALRVGGTTVAVHSFTLRIPQIPGQSAQFVLVSIIPNGARVKQGDELAQFDATTEIQNALDAKAKFDDLAHQVEDTQAQNRASAEQRASDLQQAQADLGKAQLELKKAPILSAIDAQTDQLNLEDAGAHIASLKKENALKDQADAAGLRVLELKRDQQKVEWERAQSTVAKLTLRAPLAGMVGLSPVFRSNSEGPAQPGDQLYSGQGLLRIFNPDDMAVAGQINEADGATLTPGLKGVLHLDAYPDAKLAVHFVSASPVAVAGGFGIPLRTFSVRFHVDQADPRLFPDLSAAVDLEVASGAAQLLVPRAAVHFVQKQPYVTKREAGGGWGEQAVELGNFDDHQIAILAGLAAGDEVRVPADAPGDAAGDAAGGAQP